MRLLGIDHGLARIGIAAGDTKASLAREVTIIKRRTKADDFARIQQIAAEQRVIAFVVGVPLDADAPEAAFTQADKVRNWIGYLQSALPYPILTWDEALSSVDATVLSKARGRRPADPIDDLAARVMLQSFLDALREGRASLPENLMESER
ncbi:MAG: Holliday junction resolvase RuvX [Chloroflexota bacterium]|mgnify:CR=1 FL=1|nr:Holliday junction resolvase RuvX [Chloroflexota bacterium]